MEPNPQQEEAQNQEGNGGRDTPAPSIQNRVDREPEPERADARANKRQRQLPTVADWWQVGIQAALLLGAFIAICIYSGQLDEMRRSTDAATNAAYSAKVSLNLMRRMSKIDQRAWVGVDKIEGDEPKKGEIEKEGGITEERFVITSWMTFKNFGKTPAREVDGAVNIGFVWQKSTNPPQEPKSTGIHAVVAPGQTYTALGDLLLVNPKIMQEIITGELLVMVRGKVTYEDIFGCKHWATACGRLNPNTWHYEACEKYKEATNADSNLCDEERGPKP